MPVTPDLRGAAKRAARAAGAAAMAVYHRRLRVEAKSDGSPVTLADKLAHRAAWGVLSRTGIRVVSEEGDSPTFASGTYWLVDPLDGTKDFLARNDEFTVNIALIDRSRPRLGVVYAPALRELFIGEPGRGSRKERGSRSEALEVGLASREPLMLISRFHHNDPSERFARRNGIARTVPVGASLKYCRLASGDADVYPRFAGTSEWDTAAGQAVLEGVGGRVLDLSTGRSLRYGKPDRLNGPFIAFRAPYRAHDFSTDDARPAAASATPADRPALGPGAGIIDGIPVVREGRTALPSGRTSDEKLV